MVSLENGVKLRNGKYIIDQFLSSGGFGYTYLAHEATTKQRVAIKELFIKEICTRSEDTRNVTISVHQNKTTFLAHLEKFKKEADRLSDITHDNVVKVIECFEENGTAYYVMEYIGGCTLKERAIQVGGFDETEVSKLLPNILASLDRIHSNGLYHMDIKPGNIMLRIDGTPVLIDFGASKHIVDESGNTVATSSAIAMTMGYASPEQLELNLNKIGAWTDLYSLGATLYFCISLKNPPSPSEIVENGSQTFDFPESASPKLRNLIVWLMNPTITKRPQSAEEVLLWWQGSSTAIPVKENDNEYDTVIVEGVEKKTTNKSNLKFQLYIVIGMVVIGIVAFSLYKGGIYSSIIDGDSIRLDTVDSITVIPQKDSLCVRFASLQKDNFVIYQDSLDRIIYILRHGYPQDLCVYNVKDSTTRKIKTSILSEVVDTLLIGRNNDEVFVFSVVGSGAFGSLSRIDVNKKMENLHMDLGAGFMNVIKKVTEGFDVLYFKGGLRAHSTKNEYWTNTIDYNGNIIKTMEKDYHSEDIMTQEELDNLIYNGMHFTRISITDDYTILNIKYTSDSEWITIDKGAYIVANGMNYYLIKAEGIEISPRRTYLSGVDDAAYFKLYFQPIPQSTTSIDFIEPGDSDWKFYDINIQR